MPNKTRFQETWLSDSGCMEWIVPSVSNKMFQAKLCKCGISLSNIGEKALHSHTAGERNKKRFIGVLIFSALSTIFIMLFVKNPVKFCKHKK